MTPDPLPTSQPMRPRAMASVVGLDLDTRIEQVEQRLVAREAWLRSTAESLGQRTRIALTPSPWVLPALGVGVVLWLGWRWWYRREPEPRVSVNVPVTVAERHDDGLAGLPWAGLAATVLPLSPPSSSAAACRAHLKRTECVARQKGPMT